MQRVLKCIRTLFFHLEVERRLIDRQKLLEVNGWKTININIQQGEIYNENVTVF